jgi:hypothetical protein
MTILDRNFFRRQTYTAQQLHSFERSAREDLAIAAQSEYTQVKFRFCYDALLKLGILLAARAGYKVRSVPGHHIKLLEALADLAETPDVEVMADAMRQKRNMNLYEGGAYVSDSEAAEYLRFVLDLFKRLGL